MFKIIPVEILPDGRKKPLIKDWTERASNDLDQINKWVQKFGSRIKYWGIPTGSVNGIYALDVDTKGVNGWDTIRNEGYQIPHTLTQRTPSGGAHFIFKYPADDGYDYKNSVDTELGLDTRSEKGFIVWYESTIPTEYHLAEVPEWLKVKVRKKPNEIRSGKIIQVNSQFIDNLLYVASWNIRNAEAHGANNVINEMAFKVGQYLYSGLNKDHALNTLLHAARIRGKDDSESIATINSGLEGGSKLPEIEYFDCIDVKKPVGSIDLAMFVMAGNTRYTPVRGTIHELFDDKALKRESLFEGWSTKDLSIISGDGGVGKSTLAIMESICLRLGLPFLGFNNSLQGGKTLYLTAEDNNKKILAVAGKILTQMGYKSDYNRLNHLLDGFFVKLDPTLKLVSRDSSGAIVSNKAMVDKILEAAQDLKPDRIVFDPISYMWAYESQVNEMGDALAQAMAKIRDEVNCETHAVNHIGKTSSNHKDMTQFAGRGGTAFVNRSRVTKILITLSNDDYRKYTGKELKDKETGILCNIAKFTDGSDHFNKPFVIKREGYLFVREDVTGSLDEDFESDGLSDHALMTKIINFIKYERQQEEYPPEAMVEAHMTSGSNKIAKIKLRSLIAKLEYHGMDGIRVSRMKNPDLTKSGNVYYLINDMDEEIK